MRGSLGLSASENIESSPSNSADKIIIIEDSFFNLIGIRGFLRKAIN